jgi:5'-methylthioadenosine phosphorylase
MRFAIVAGVGFEAIVPEEAEWRRVKTGYGEVPLAFFQHDCETITVLPRHGLDHYVPSHLVNYQANAAALCELDVEHVLATTAVASLNRLVAPGQILVLSQFLDFTRSAPATLYDEQSHGRHVDMREPYCLELQRDLVDAGVQLGLDIHGGGTYLCVEGPRFCTAAEMALYQQWGADVLGMSNAPEATLAREAGICYAAVAVVTNWADTRFPASLPFLEARQIIIDEHKDAVTELFWATMERHQGGRCCWCGSVRDISEEAPGCSRRNPFMQSSKRRWHKTRRTST